MSGAGIVRTLAPEEVGLLVRWAEREGWNPSPDDADAFRAADPEGFLGCFVDGDMVAGISAVAYGKTFGFIGLYIVRPDMRGKGYGLKVWQAAMARLEGRTIGLDGVPAQQANYERGGFQKAYTTTRWSGRAASEHQPLIPVDIGTGSDLDDILSVDRLCFPGPRRAFLEGWIKPPRLCFTVRAAGRLTGYAVMRRCMTGFKVGPVFAADDATAISLLIRCSQSAESEMLHLDVPDSQAGLTAKLSSMGFQRGFETARMYHGKAPSIAMDQVFAVTTLELG